MKFLVLISLFLSANFFEGPASSTYDGVRIKYFAALKDSEKALHLYEEDYEGIQEKDALILAYKGALEALLTKTTWNFIKKISYLKESRTTFDKAYKLDPNNVEVRFLRLAVESQIPSYLGFSEHVDQDRKFVLSHLNQFNFNELDSDIQEEILSFFINCEEFNSADIRKIKTQLALNN